MKKSFYKFLLVLIPIFCANTIYAQKDTIKDKKVWNLIDCIGYALDNNLQIKRQALQTEIAKNNLLQSKIDLLPEIGVSANHAFGIGSNSQNFSVIKQKYSYGNMGAGGNLDLFRGLRKINTIMVNKNLYNLSMSNFEKAKNDISLAIASAYLQILFSNEILDVSKNQLDISNLQVEKTKKLFEVGNLAKGSLLEIEAQAAADEANLTSAQNQLNLAYISLTQILDLDTIKNFKVYIPSELEVPAYFTDNPDSIYQIALNNMPEIKGYEYQLKSSQYQLAVARGSRYPTLTMSGSIGPKYDLKEVDALGNKVPLLNQLKNKFENQISFTLQIPIFTKFQIQTGINNAKINVKDNEFALKQGQLTLRKEVEQAYADALAAFQNYKSREKSADAYEENFKYVQQKFDVGLINSVDYNVAKNNFVKAKSDFLQSKYEFIFKTKILEFYKGNVIKL